MKKLILGIFLTFSLQPSALLAASYSIYIAPQIPEFITVNGPYGPEQIKNSQQFSCPASYVREICRAENYSPYAADPARRATVYEDLAGTATSAELFAACPQIREIKSAEIRSAGALQLSALATPYLPEERETWATQQREARAWLLDHEAETPMINALALVRGLAIDELVGLIMENVALFEAASGQILGLQQRLLDRIAVEPDFATLVAIKWQQ